MYTTIKIYISDGRQTEFAVPMSYIKSEYVKLYSQAPNEAGYFLEDLVPLDFNWINDGLVRLSSPVASGQRVIVRRETHADTPLVDFQDAAILVEDDLDLATLQALHVAQEAKDTNGSEVIEATRNVLKAASEVKELTVRAESAAENTAQDLSEVRELTAATRQAKESVDGSEAHVTDMHDDIVARSNQVAADAAQVADSTALIERLAGEVAVNTETVERCTADVTVKTEKVTEEAVKSQVANESALDAAARAEAAAVLAEAAAGVDLSIYVEKTALETTVSDLTSEINTKADSASVTSALAGKSSIGHQHPQSDITGLATTLNEKVNKSDLKGMAGIEDAPATGQTYGRKSGAWAEIKNQPFPLMVGQVTPYFGAVGNKAAFEPNFLYADGRAVSRTQYPELFAAYGTIYGAGNGSTTFNIPDLRGVFVRGLDEGRGLDPGRVLGAVEGDAIREIEGNSGMASTSVPTILPSGPFYLADKAAGVTAMTGSAVNSSTKYTYYFKASRQVPVAHENRPVNMACHWFIVAQSPAMASPSDFTAAINAVNASMGTIRNEVAQSLDTRLAQVLHVQEQQPNGTGSGTFTAGAWRTRALNTVVSNTLDGSSLNNTTNAIALPAGRYEIRGYAIAYAAGHHMSIVANTAGNALLLGSTEYSGAGIAVTNKSNINGVVILSSATSINLQHRCSATASNGFGTPCTLGLAEVYSELIIRRLK